MKKKQVRVGVLKNYSFEPSLLDGFYPTKEFIIDHDNDSILGLYKKLVNHEIDCLVILCKDHKNFLYDDFHTLLSYIQSSEIVEVGAFCHNNEMTPDDELALEYRLFERAEKTKSQNLVSLFFFLLCVFSSDIAVYSVSILSVILSIIASGINIPIAVTISILALQIITKTDSFKALANFTMISGYWIYYSVPTDKKMLSAMPSGFTTRIIHSHIDNFSTVFSGYFPGSTTPFFHAHHVSAKYSKNLKKVEVLYKFSPASEDPANSQIEGTAWFYGERNNQFLSTFDIFDGWYCGRKTRVFGTLRYMRLSKRQFQMISNCKTYMNASVVKPKTTKKIGLYGQLHSQTHLAAKTFFTNQDHDFVFYLRVDELINDLKNKKLNCAVIPIYNSMTKNILPYQKCIKESQLVLLNKIKAPVNYVLASMTEDFSKIRYVAAHWQSLEQCKGYLENRQLKFLSTRKLKTLAENDSATIAHLIANDKSSMINTAVICSRSAAEDNLYKRIEEIDLEVKNETTFGIYI